MTPLWQRFTKRSACVRISDDVKRQAESDRKLVSGACHAGELVDRTLVAIEAGELDAALSVCRYALPGNFTEEHLDRAARESWRIRFAAMDRYDGMVWGASDNALPGPADDSFQRVSSTIDNPVEGDEVDATITLGEGWKGVWLPTVGALRSLATDVDVTRRPRAEWKKANEAACIGVVA